MRKWLYYIWIIFITYTSGAQPLSWMFNTTPQIHSFSIDSSFLERAAIGKQIHDSDAVAIFKKSAYNNICLGYARWYDAPALKVNAYLDWSSLDSAYEIRYWDHKAKCELELNDTLTNKRLTNGGSTIIKKATIKPLMGDYPQLVYYLKNSNPLPKINNTGKITYATSNTNLNLNSQTGEIDLAQSKAGIYTIKLSSSFCLYSDSISLTLADSSLSSPNISKLKVQTIQPTCELLGALLVDTASITGLSPFTYRLTSTTPSYITFNSTDGYFNYIPYGEYKLVVIDRANKETEYEAPFVFKRVDTCSLDLSTMTLGVANASCQSLGVITIDTASIYGVKPFNFEIVNRSKQSYTVYKNWSISIAEGDYDIYVISGDNKKLKFPDYVSVFNDCDSLDLSNLKYTASLANCIDSKGSFVIDTTSFVGLSPLSFRLKNIATSEVFYNQINVFLSIPIGTYYLYVTDARGLEKLYPNPISIKRNNNCTSDSLDISQLKRSITPATCEGKGVVKIDTSTVKGTKPLVYKLTNITTLDSLLSTNGHFGAVSIGKYILTVYDSKGNSAKDPNHLDVTGNSSCFNITNLKLEAISPDCISKGFIKIDTTTLTGIRPFTYRIENIIAGIAVESKDGGFQNLEQGDYVLFVKEATGSQKTYPSVISLLKSTSCDTLNIERIEYKVDQPICESNGSIKVNSESVKGKKPFTFELINQNTGISFSSSDGTFNNLTEGIYSLSVSDARGWSKTVPQVIKLEKLVSCKNAVLTPDMNGGTHTLIISEVGLARILNREGKLIKEIAIPGEWDCTNLQGTPVPMGDYYLFINNVQSKVVTVLR